MAPPVWVPGASPASNRYMYANYVKWDDRVVKRRQLEYADARIRGISNKAR